MASKVVRIDRAEEQALWLELPDGQSFEDWKALGRRLATGVSAVSWCIGDWWNAGERRYGETAAIEAAESIFHRDHATIRGYGWVAGKFENVRRRTDLSFGHHHAVAALGQDQADEFLESAARASESVAHLRERVRQHALAGSGHIDRMAQDEGYMTFALAIRTWNKMPADYRSRLVRLAARVKYGEIEDPGTLRRRWTDEELAIVKDAVGRGLNFEETRALLPGRTDKGVMWVYYAERESQDRDEPAALSDAMRQKDGKEGSLALLQALIRAGFAPAENARASV